MGWISTLAAAILLISTGAHTSSVTPVLHEERHDLPPGWSKLGRVPSHMLLPVRVGLVQSNMDKAHGYLMDVSHPDSANYGKYWTSEEVIEAFNPTTETVASVWEWLVESGIDSDSISQSDNKVWLAFYATADQMEALLETEYYEYEDTDVGGIMPACERYYLPQHIQPHVDYITPGVKLMATHATPQHTRETKVALSQQSPGDSHSLSADSHRFRNCFMELTPACVRALYDIPLGNLSEPNNSMGIFEAQVKYWDQTDLDLFFSTLAPFIPNGTHPIDHDVDGGVAEKKNITGVPHQLEALLDIQVAYPIVYPQTITDFNVDDLHYQAWPNDTYTWGFNTLLDAIDGSYCTYCAFGECGDAPGIDPTYPDPAPGGYKGKLQCGVYNTTNVIASSYSGQESSVPIAYQKRQCNEFLKLGLQGVSLFFASGDAGVGAAPAPKGTGCIGHGDKIFSPTWPLTCPYITAVGGSEIAALNTPYQPEVVFFETTIADSPMNYSSGGGFSNIYPIPDYQKAALEKYFSQHDPPYKYYSELAANAPNPTHVNGTALAGTTGGVYNRIGRGVPDVSANAKGYAFYSEGRLTIGGGTSQSTPLFASIINRINEERIHAGKSPVGFVNPALYANPDMLHDITNGSNPNCHTDGFSAVKGWDPATGLGTPNYPRMLKYFMSLQ